jgi:hypothetical protein
MSRLSPSCPFWGVGLGSIIPRGSISLPVTFGMFENYHMESIIFDIAEVNLPFNTIIDRSYLYLFMAVAHYGYLVLKMPSPNSIIKIHRDRSTGVSTLEKLQEVAVAYEVPAGQGALDQTPSSSCQCVSSSMPPRAALRQRGCPREDRPARCGCRPDYPHRGEPW